MHEHHYQLLNVWKLAIEQYKTNLGVSYCNLWVLPNDHMGFVPLQQKVWCVSQTHRHP
jgi:hypothetical protein